MRLIQHKREAYWFYRFLSLGYDRWVNPLFWTPAMRAAALDEARLERGLRVLDVGRRDGVHDGGDRGARGCGRRDDARPEPAPARAQPGEAGAGACTRVLGDAEALPFGDDAFDRYVSAGSIEYWPDPLRGIAEAYRVTRAGGTALVIGPVRPANRFARALAEAWMLFPPVEDYIRWMEAAGFEDVRVRELAPDWYRDKRVPYALAVSGVKRAPGPSPAPPRRSPEPPVRAAAVRRAVRARLGGGRGVRADRGRARAARAAGEGAAA